MAKLPFNPSDYADEASNVTPMPAPEPIRADIETHLDFMLKDPGSISLITIVPDGPIERRDFVMPADKQKAVHWITSENVAGKNLYWQVNGVKAGKQKASKEAITTIRGHWGDFDPVGGNRDAWRAGMSGYVEKLKEYDPTLILDSGNGVQSIWMYEQPVPLEPGMMEPTEQANQRFLSILGDHGKTFNADRIMRIAGTLNWPNAAKLKAGYGKTPAVARLLHVGKFLSRKEIGSILERIPGGGIVTAEDMQDDGQFKELDGVKARDVNVLKESFSDLLRMHSKLMDRYLGSTDGLKDTSGSGMDMSMVAAMKGSGFNWRECAVLLADWPHGSQAGRSGSKADREYHWKRCWARSQVEFVEDDPDEFETHRVTLTDENISPDYSLFRMVRPGITVMWGVSGAGKTSAILPIACMVAGISNAMPEIHPSVPKVVVYMTEDMEQVDAIFKGMIRAGQVSKDFDKWIVFQKVSRRPINRLARLIGKAREKYRYDHEGRWVNPLIIMDTVPSTIELVDDNDNAEVGRALDQMKIGLDDGHLWLLHHPSKIGENPSIAMLLDAGVRGAGNWKNLVNGSAAIWKKPKEERRFFILGKLRIDTAYPALELVSKSDTFEMRDYWGVRKPWTASVYWGIPRGVSKFELDEILSSDEENSSNGHNQQSKKDAKERAIQTLSLLVAFLSVEEAQGRVYTENQLCTDVDLLKQIGSEDFPVRGNMVRSAINFDQDSGEENVEGSRLEKRKADGKKGYYIVVRKVN